MTTLTEKFDAFEAQTASEHDEVMAAFTDLHSLIAELGTQNAQLYNLILAQGRQTAVAIGQTGSCFPCPTPSVTVPPTVTTPTDITGASCQRTQGIVATLHAILAAMDTMQGYNVAGTFNVLNDAISQVVGAITAGDTIPLPTFPETVNITGDYFSYASERIFTGVDLLSQFSPLETTLIQALWLDTDPAAAQADYDGIIDGSSASNSAKLLFKAIAYNALWGYYYDPASLPDVSGYSPSACGVFSCEVLNSAPTSINGGSPVDIIVWTPHYLPTDSSFGVTSDHLTWATISMTGFIVTPSVNVHIFVRHTDSPTSVGSGTAYTITGATDAVAIVRDGGSGAFTAEVCPPA